MQETSEWGSFRGYLTWKDWVSAFSSGGLLILWLATFLKTGSLLHGAAVIALAGNAVRECLAFRRKLRTLIDLVEPGRV